MDLNTFAKSVVDQAIGDAPKKKRPNPNATVRGVARKVALTSDQRRAIAVKAAAKRWRQGPSANPQR